MDEVTLFKSIKKRLRVSFDTFDDEIKELIEEGQSYLVDKAGSLPFTEETKTNLGNNSRALLKYYCQYNWNDNGHLFYNDFKQKILELQISALKSRMEVADSVGSLRKF